MRRKRSTPSFEGLSPKSENATAAARGASKKTDTRCELALRHALRRRGLHYRLHHPELPGRPDVVFIRQRIAVFCDGDFWHGRGLEERLAKLARGHNASYWVAKVRRNAQRDRETTAALEAVGWVVLRFWESDVLRDPEGIADRVKGALARVDLHRLPPRTQGCTKLID